MQVSRCCSWEAASWGDLTINVILHECLIVLVVVNQLDDLKQVVFLELDESIRHLLNIEGLLLLLGATLDLASLAVLVGGDGTRLAQNLLETLGGVLEGNQVLLLVAGLLEVEIVWDGDLTALVRIVEIDVHLELAPALILTGERRGSEGYRTGAVRNQASK